MNKKMILLGLASTMVLSGCGSSESTTVETPIVAAEDLYAVDANVPAWQLDTREDIDLHWYVNAEWFNTDYGNDTVTKKLQEDLNLTINFSTGDDTKLTTYFAGGELPDIITIFGGNSQIALSANTWALSLEDLANEYDPYFFQVANDQTLSWYTLDDGNVYGYPSYSNSQDDYDSGLLYGRDAFVIRKDIYEALGEPSLNTPEQFLDVMGQIAEMFPEVTPFGFRSFGDSGDVGSIGGTLQNHLGVPIVTADGEFYDRNLDEEYLTWISTFNEAYKLGYISQDNFADNNTIYEEKVAAGSYATMMVSGVAQLGSALGQNLAADPAREYIAIDGPQSAYGEATLDQAGLSGWTVTYISKDCQDPAKAIQLFTYLLSDEGQFLTTFGVEGETFNFNEDGKAVFTDEMIALRADNPDLFKAEQRMGEFWFFGHDLFALENGLDQRAAAIKDIQDWSTDKIKPQFLIENIDPETGTLEARSLININSTWATTLASAIQAPDDTTFDSIIDSYRTFLDNNNFDSIVEIRNENIISNAEKLGITDF